MSPNGQKYLDRNRSNNLNLPGPRKAGLGLLGTCPVNPTPLCPLRDPKTVFHLRMEWTHAGSSTIFSKCCAGWALGAMGSLSCTQQGQRSQSRAGPLTTVIRTAAGSMGGTGWEWHVGPGSLADGLARGIHRTKLIGSRGYLP